MLSTAKLFDLSGKAAIVTGAAKGIGEAIGRRLAEAGAAVILTDTDVEGVEAVAKNIRQGGGRAQGLRADAASVASAQEVVAKTVEAFGRLDILVNNAGIFPISSAFETDEALWDKVMAVNLKGAFFHAQAAARAMRQYKGGSIVNVASIDALHPAGALAHYDASKGGLLMLSRSLALELAPFGIRVNTVCPGGVATPGAEAALAKMGQGAPLEKVLAGFAARVPLRRMGEPDDIANAVLYLVAPAASYVTGASLVVDGGYLLA